MQKPLDIRLTIISKSSVGDGIYHVVCAASDELPPIKAGCFAHIKVPNRDLRRPICVYKSDRHTVDFIIAAVGSGTKAFTELDAGAEFDAMLPLGNGFPIFADQTNAVLLGGGTGCAPLLKIAADNANLSCTAILGFASKAHKDVYGNDFDKVCKRVYYCTDDGSVGYHGYPTDLLTETAPEVLYVCGPMPLVKTARDFCKARGIKGYVSKEQHMGCGVGACLVCAVEIMRDGKVHNLRACADGPVFDIEEIVL